MDLASLPISAEKLEELKAREKRIFAFFGPLMFACMGILQLGGVSKVAYMMFICGGIGTISLVFLPSRIRLRGVACFLVGFAALWLAYDHFEYLIVAVSSTIVSFVGLICSIGMARLDFASKCEPEHRHHPL